MPAWRSATPCAEGRARGRGPYSAFLAAFLPDFLALLAFFFAGAGLLLESDCAAGEAGVAGVAGAAVWAAAANTEALIRAASRDFMRVPEVNEG